MKIIVGISGKAGSGKDTVAGFIEDWFHGYRIRANRIAFADALKRTASIMFDVPIDCFYDVEKKETNDPFWGITYREILQKLGTEGARRLFGEDFWIRRMEKELDKDFDGAIIIPDVRFDNEAMFIRNKGGIVFNVFRPDLDSSDAKYKHESEQGITLFKNDVFINNCGTLDDLKMIVFDELDKRKGDVLH